jgi:hypothetical protein
LLSAEGTLQRAKKHFLFGKGFVKCMSTWYSSKPCRQRELYRMPRGHSAKVTFAVNLTAPFAECRDNTWQRFFICFLKKSLSSALASDTRQRLIFFFEKYLPSDLASGTQVKIYFFKKKYLPGVDTRQRNGHFAECQPSTRQSWVKCPALPSADTRQSW